MNVTINFAENSIFLDMVPKVVEEVKISDIDFQHLKQDEKAKLEQLVTNFSTLFPEKPGNTQIVTHAIELKSSEPCKAKPYHYDKEKGAIIEHHIKKMLRDKIIILINSKYVSPVVLCRKRNYLSSSDPKAYCFAIHYRKLNNMTKFPAYSLPVIEEIIRKIRSTKYMTTLDLTSGYFQIAMKPEDVNKTAFITKSGTYAFSLMLFGLCGSPSTFQLAMGIILLPVLGKSTLIYLDDIIITSDTIEQHVEDLHEVFSLLTLRALRIKFFVQERELEFKQANIQNLIDKALKNYDVARKRQKIYYDRKRRESDFKKGDKVLKRKFTLSSAPENVVSKFAHKFEGPYVVQQIIGAVIYLKTDSGERIKVSPDQLKKYYYPEDFDVLHDFFQASDLEEAASPGTIVTAAQSPPPRKSKEPKKLQVFKPTEEFRRKESLNV
ncbi:Retrovirus-related Pol polyprotein from transposon 297, partial [Stegodyphus mimosarum]